MGAASADRFGGIDALMTNSGGPPAGLAISFDDQAWQDAADLLLFSTIRMVRAAVPLMKARGGGAILVSTSSSVKEPVPNLGLSTVLRASVSALAKTLAIELAPSKIRVNQIIPGRIDTDRVRHLDEVNAKKQGVSADEAKARAIATIPMGRYGEGPEFGRVGAFLLSDAASYMTGATVQVDGGLIKSVLSCPDAKVLLAGSTNPWLRDRATKTAFVRRSVSRFMPGEQIDDALRAAAELKPQGITTILTKLGENLTGVEEAEQVTQHYLDVLDRIAASRPRRAHLDQAHAARPRSRSRPVRAESRSADRAR